MRDERTPAATTRNFHLHRRPFIVLTALLASSAASLQTGVAFAQTTRPADLDPSRMAADQVAAASRQLAEPNVDQDARDAAARRLLSIGSSEARSAVGFALRDPGNNAGRLAAARAVADDRPPDPQFVDALFVLMDADTPRTLLDAAAVALGNYKAEADVATRLVRLTDAGRPDVLRVAAIRALSTQIEKVAGQRLVELTQDNAAAVANAATDALQTFASLPLSTPADWANWWRTQGDHADDRFRTEMLLARATRFEQESRHGDETFQELRKSILTTISATAKEQRGEVLMRYLASPREAVRLIAVRQAYDYATTGDLPANCRPIIRAMLSDTSADVRLQAARAVQPLNDPEAFGPIAQQLAVEPDTRVRVELANAMGPMGNLAAVPVLRMLLEDPSTSVVRSAANALASLGPAFAKADPAAAADLASRLQLAMQSRRETAVREALLRATVPLGQRSMLGTFSAMLTANPGEPEVMRALAAAGLGAIGEPQTGSILVDALSDPSPGVRLAAVSALGQVSNSFFYAEAVYRSMDPKREVNPGVREAAWSVLGKLFDLAPRKQLASWPDQPLIRADPSKRILIYQTLSKKAAADNDSDTQAFCLEQVADAQMEMAKAEPARYAEATATYQQALALTRATRGPSMRVEKLIELTMRSTLRGRDYAGAVRFAVELVNGPSGSEYQSTVGKEFKLEAERLVNEESKFDDAAKLIREALAMTPALPAQYRDHLVEVQRSLDRRQHEKNQMAAPDFMQSLASTR